jgi:hypothetical protein
VRQIATIELFEVELAHGPVYWAERNLSVVLPESGLRSVTT